MQSNPCVPGLRVYIHIYVCCVHLIFLKSGPCLTSHVSRSLDENKVIKPYFSTIFLLGLISGGSHTLHPSILWLITLQSRFYKFLFNFNYCWAALVEPTEKYHQLIFFLGDPPLECTYLPPLLSFVGSSWCCWEKPDLGEISKICILSSSTPNPKCVIKLDGESNSSGEIKRRQRNQTTVIDLNLDRRLKEFTFFRTSSRPSSNKVVVKSRRTNINTRYTLPIINT